MSSVEETKNNFGKNLDSNCKIENPQTVEKITGESILIATMLGLEKLVCNAVLNGVPINYSDKYGVQAIHIAAHYGNSDILSVLLELHADVNATANGGYTPLLIAAGGGICEKELRENFSQCKYLKPIPQK